jgi:hypothetical protein
MTEDTNMNENITIINKNMEINKPNGKSSQTFYFMNPWEAKHALGIKHKKRLDFKSREGIATIEFSGGFGNNAVHGNKYGKFSIRGKIDAVDKMMIEIHEYLEKCQFIHYEMDF